MSNHPARIAPALQPRLQKPAHIGVTMDGNRRWAEARNRPRTEGHREGIKALRRLVDCCIRHQIDYVTVFSFSSENWRRPKTEIEFIFNLMRSFVATDLESLVRNNVRVRILGERRGLESGLLKVIAQVEADTARNTGLNLNVAFNYGGKAEISTAVRQIAQSVLDGELEVDDIDEKQLSSRLFTGGMPDPDLMIRTGGENRISNFMIWQAAYAELVFLDAYWPDFNEEMFVESLEIYSARQRRFGGDGDGDRR